uniref:CCHC-type domain-containing protein n=1 Tax=Ananas comosus var. bracteatus TaxID=296719 RepID=A0A6V7P9V4_ANACO|nr:unnamed protein product [Ananas comosus var. bracteatus]
MGITPLYNIFGVQGREIRPPTLRNPPLYPRQQSRNWKPSRCVICGSDHRPSTCPQREGKCFKCGQPGHLIRECSGWVSSAPTVASVPSSPRQLAGLPPAMSAGRASSPCQPEGSRAPSEQVFATQVEEQPAVPDDVVASIISINGTRARALFHTVNLTKVRYSLSSFGILHKHIDVKFHFVRDVIGKHIMTIKKIGTEDNLLDMLTKSLTIAKFKHCLDLVAVGST